MAMSLQKDDLSRLENLSKNLSYKVIRVAKFLLVITSSQYQHLKTNKDKTSYARNINTKELELDSILCLPLFTMLFSCRIPIAIYLFFYSNLSHAQEKSLLAESNHPWTSLSSWLKASSVFRDQRIRRFIFIF